MKVKVTRNTGFMPGSVEQLLSAEGITKLERPNPESDSVIIATMTPAQLDALRNRYYQPHKLEVIEPDSPPAPAEKTYSQAEYDAAVKDAYEAGYLAGASAKGKARNAAS